MSSKAPEMIWRVINKDEPNKPMWWVRGPISPEDCLGYEGTCYILASLAEEKVRQARAEAAEDTQVRIMLARSDAYNEVADYFKMHNRPTMETYFRDFAERWEEAAAQARKGGA